MITDEQIEAALDWLRDSAVEHAQARANRIYLESWVKVVLAQEMARFPDLSAAAQEREARRSYAYNEALVAMRDAIKIDEENRFLRSAREARIEAFRTQEATRRAEGKAYS